MIEEFIEGFVEGAIGRFPEGNQQIMLNADVVTPSTQEVYASLARLAAVTGKTWAEFFVCDIVGGNLTGHALTSLVNGGGTFHYRSTWPGWDGASMTAMRALEFVGTATAAQGFAAADPAVFDMGDSMCFVVQLRLLRPPSAARTLFSKQAAYAAGSPGYTIYINTSGQVIAEAADGLTQITGASNFAKIDGLAMGAPQWVAVRYNLTTNKLRLFSLASAGVEVNIPSAAAKTNATTFKFGGSLFNSCETLQVLQWGVLTGADAEAFGLAELALLDGMCRAPSALAHYARYCHTSPIVGRDAGGLRVQHVYGSAVNTAFQQFAHGWSANATWSPQGLGWESQRGVGTSGDTGAPDLKKRNRLLWTDNIADAAWTKTNITATKNAGEDPSGFYGAASLLATAGGGFVAQNFTGDANERYTVSVFAQRIGGVNVAARLALYNSTGPVELAGVDITIGATRERYTLEVPAATVGAVTTLQWRLTITVNGTSVLATFAQAEWGTLTSYQPQQDILYDRNQCEWYFDNANRSVYNPLGGRVEVTVCGYASEAPYSGCFLFSSNAGAGNEDRHFIQRDALTSAFPREARIYDSAGVIVSMLTDIADVDHTEETTYASEWNSRHKLRKVPAFHTASVDDVAVETGNVVAVAPWQVGANADRVYPGMRHNYAAHLEGIVERFRIWGPRT